MNEFKGSNVLSKKACSLKPSPTLALAAKAKELQAQGKDVVSLTVGEPDWPTFKVVSDAGIYAIQKGFTKYTAANGIPELRKAVAEETSQLLGVQFQANEVVIGSGAKFLIYGVLAMLLDLEDEVLIPSPYWVSYPTMTDLAGGKFKIIDCGKENNFKLTPKIFRNAITEKTKILILCSPSNPTGLMYTRDELRALAEVLNEYPQIFVLSDDIYNRLIFNEEKVAPHLLHVAPQMKNRVIVINGASKSYSMTGWRLGWVLGPEKLIKALGDFVSQTTSNASSIAQYAALEALTNGEKELQEALEKLRKKMNWCLEQFKALKFMKVIPPEGTFYLWVDVQSAFGRSFKGNKILNSRDIAQILLNDYFVATVPGIEFGADNFIRLSIAASDQSLEKAFQRFQAFEAGIS